MRPPTIYDLCRPRQDVLAGRIRDEDFAADLSQVLKGTAPELYKDAALFFANTHPTRGLKDLIRAVVGRLTGADSQLGSILRLDTSYGGGKTHALIGLNHILTAPEQIPNLAEFVEPATLPGQPVTVAIFDGENADPMNGRRMRGDILAYTPWGGVWQPLTREDTKQRFRQGAARIFLCTDAAAEGLNFQFCGALINYDMPWNPMRVEQRIGRIDRIGQQHPKMQVINLHLEGTVETDVYKALKDRIQMFEQVVGTLQPILAEAASVAIGRAVMVGREHRQKARDLAMAAVQQAPEVHGLDLDDGLQDPEAMGQVVNQLQPPPLSLQDLEAILERPELLPPGCGARRIGQRDFAWSQPGLKQKIRITCDPTYYDHHSESCELWVPGSPLFPQQRAMELAGSEARNHSREDFLKALGRCQAQGLPILGFRTAPGDQSRPPTRPPPR